jgi:hypothetical protein
MPKLIRSRSKSKSQRRSKSKSQRRSKSKSQRRSKSKSQRRSKSKKRYCNTKPDSKGIYYMKFNINKTKKEEKEEIEGRKKHLMTLSIRKLKDIIEDEIYEHEDTTNQKFIKKRENLKAGLKKTKTKDGLVKLIQKYNAY